MNIKLWTTDRLINEYKLIFDNIKKLNKDIKKHPNDMFLKEQWNISRKYKNKLKLELELRGVKFKNREELV